MASSSSGSIGVPEAGGGGVGGEPALLPPHTLGLSLVIYGKAGVAGCARPGGPFPSGRPGSVQPVPSLPELLPHPRPAQGTAPAPAAAGASRWRDGSFDDSYDRSVGRGSLASSGSARATPLVLMGGGGGGGVGVGVGLGAGAGGAVSPTLSSPRLGGGGGGSLGRSRSAPGAAGMGASSPPLLPLEGDGVALGSPSSTLGSAGGAGTALARSATFTQGAKGAAAGTAGGGRGLEGVFPAPPGGPRPPPSSSAPQAQALYLKRLKADLQALVDKGVCALVTMGVGPQGGLDPEMALRVGFKLDTEWPGAKRGLFEGMAAAVAGERERARRASMEAKGGGSTAAAPHARAPSPLPPLPLLQPSAPLGGIGEGRGSEGSEGEGDKRRDSGLSNASTNESVEQVDTGVPEWGQGGRRSSASRASEGGQGQGGEVVEGVAMAGAGGRRGTSGPPPPASTTSGQHPPPVGGRPVLAPAPPSSAHQPPPTPTMGGLSGIGMLSVGHTLGAGMLATLGATVGGVLQATRSSAALTRMLFVPSAKTFKYLHLPCLGPPCGLPGHEAVVQGSASAAPSRGASGRRGSVVTGAPPVCTCGVPTLDDLTELLSFYQWACVNGASSGGEGGGTGAGGGGGTTAAVAAGGGYGKGGGQGGAGGGVKHEGAAWDEGRTLLAVSCEEGKGAAGAGLAALLCYRGQAKDVGQALRVIKTDRPGSLAGQHLVPHLLSFEMWHASWARNFCFVTPLHSPGAPWLSLQLHPSPHNNTPHASTHTRRKAKSKQHGGGEGHVRVAGMVYPGSLNSLASDLAFLSAQGVGAIVSVCEARIDAGMVESVGQATGRGYKLLDFDLASVPDSYLHAYGLHLLPRPAPKAAAQGAGGGEQAAGGSLFLRMSTRHKQGGAPAAPSAAVSAAQAITASAAARGTLASSSMSTPSSSASSTSAAGAGGSGAAAGGGSGLGLMPISEDQDEYDPEGAAAREERETLGSFRLVKGARLTGGGGGGARQRGGRAAAGGAASIAEDVEDALAAIGLSEKDDEDEGEGEEEDGQAADPRFLYLHLPTIIMQPPSQSDLAAFLRLIARMQSSPLDPARPHVVVHCAAGQGRTGTLLACSLMARQGYTAEEAMGEVRRLRPLSIETVGQEECLRQYERERAEERRAALALATGMDHGDGGVGVGSFREGQGQGQAAPNTVGCACAVQ